VLETAVVAIGDGYKLDAGNPQRDLGVALSLAARADERNLDMIVGGNGPALSTFKPGQSMEPRAQQRSRGCRSGCFQKSSAIQHLQSGTSYAEFSSRQLPYTGLSGRFT
jgi:hypothetical protein